MTTKWLFVLSQIGCLLLWLVSTVRERGSPFGLPLDWMKSPDLNYPMFTVTVLTVIACILVAVRLYFFHADADRPLEVPMKGKDFLLLFAPVLAFIALVLLFQIAGPYFGFQSSQSNTELLAILALVVIALTLIALSFRLYLSARRKRALRGSR